MSDKEKRKGKPRSRVYLGLAIVLILIVAGFFVVPFATDFLQAWLDDDPFTPICDAGNLELAFVRDWNAYTIRGNGQNQHLLGRFAAGDDYQAVFEYSPHRDWFAYETREDGEEFLNIVNSNSGETHRRVPINAHYHRYASRDWYWVWFPSHFVFTDMDVRALNDYDANLMAMPLETNTPPFIVEEDVTNFWDVSYSPDGSKVLAMGYWGFNDGGFALVTVGDDIQYQPITSEFHSISDGNIAWLPDNQHVIFSSLYEYFDENYDTVRVYGTYILDTVTGEIEKILDESISFSLAPDGNRLAYTTTEGVHLLSIGGEELGFMEYQKPYLDENNFQHPKRVLAWRDDYLYVMESETFFEELLAQKLLVFDLNSQSLIEEIPLSGLAHNLDNTVTPDNHYLTYQAENNWLYLLDLETYESCRVVKGDENGITRYDWRIVPQD